MNQSLRTGEVLHSERLGPELARRVGVSGDRIEVEAVSVSLECQAHMSLFGEPVIHTDHLPVTCRWECRVKANDQDLGKWLEKGLLEWSEEEGFRASRLSKDLSNKVPIPWDVEVVIVTSNEV